MKIIISHTNTDFDALASMIAAHKLHPDATLVITTKQTSLVKQFLTIYRDTFEMKLDDDIDWSLVSEMIVVDVATLNRLGNHAKHLNLDDVKVTIYDHHPKSDNNIIADHEQIEEIGATVTMLIEKIIEQNIQISSLEATLFGLGIYTDTGSFTYPNTTEREFAAATHLIRNGMNLSLIQKFSVHNLTDEQDDLLNTLYFKSNSYVREGLKFVISYCEHPKFIKGLAVVAEKLLDVSSANMVLCVVKMKNTVFIVGRANSERINLIPLLSKFGGGGHREAGSASVKKAELSDVLNDINKYKDLLLTPSVIARDIMASPVKSLTPETTMVDAGEKMYRYGHSGYPVVRDGKLVGIITRRDLDKANHHGLGHAPIKAYMSTELITAKPETTIEELQSIVINHNVGRIPIMDNDKIIGIVTRTDIIEVMHSKQLSEALKKPKLDNLKELMSTRLPESTYQLLKDISKSSGESHVNVYLIGGIVRDLFLDYPNDDVDITVEGDGISFAKQLVEDYGGTIVSHESFGTATWTHPNGEQIDVTSARLEYYARPASLPDVERASLKMDLNRRDFTINSMAVRLNPRSFGKLVDPFHGQQDLRSNTIRILHNLSFIEDPTRIFRAVRFESRFNFKMDSQTLTLAHNSIGRIKDLSEDRMIGQMKALFNDRAPSKAMLRLFDLHFWRQFDIQDECRESSTIHVKQLEGIYDRVFEEEYTINWINYFAIPFYQSEVLDKIEPYLMSRGDRKFIQDVKALMNQSELLEMETAWELHPKLKNYSNEAILFFVTARPDTNAEPIVDYLVRRQKLVNYLTGEDMINEGYKPGKYFRNILLALEVAVLNGEVDSRESAIEWLLKNHSKS